MKQPIFIQKVILARIEAFRTITRANPYIVYNGKKERSISYSIEYESEYWSPRG